MLSSSRSLQPASRGPSRSHGTSLPTYSRAEEPSSTKAYTGSSHDFIQTLYSFRPLTAPCTLSPTPTSSPGAPSHLCCIRLLGWPVLCGRETVGGQVRVATPLKAPAKEQSPERLNASRELGTEWSMGMMKAWSLTSGVLPCPRDGLLDLQ